MKKLIRSFMLMALIFVTNKILAQSANRSLSNLTSPVMQLEKVA